MSDRRGFDKIIGQQIATRVLAKAVREGNPAQTYLFLGMEGVGKAATALELAKALNCENPQDGNACGECAICRMIEHHNFPDIRLWSPPKKDTTIDQMHEMRELANFQPVRGKWQVNIIEKGDTLNEDAANSILKLLEEPPPYLINILLYVSAGSILPTIRSRSQLVRFTQVPADELVQRLEEDYSVGDEEARFLTAYSQGCPGKAIGLIGNEEFRARRDSIISTARAASSGKPWLALKLAESLISSQYTSQDQDDEADDGESAPAATSGPKKSSSKRATGIASLDILLLWYRDLLAMKLQGEDAALVNLDKRDEATDQSKLHPHAGRLLVAVEAILQTRRALVGNANPQIATEALMMRLTA